jgi:alkylation response protein AidB-like acyl-CoA dehydrogenase
MTGDAEFNEVFLSEVCVPDICRLGPRGEGWRVATTTLLNERTALAGEAGWSGGQPPEQKRGQGGQDRKAPSMGGLSIERLIGLAQSSDRSVACRQRIAQAWIESRVIRWTLQRSQADGTRGREPGSEGSIAKLLQTEHNQRLQELAVDVLALSGTARLAEDESAEAVWRGFLRSRANTIEGGTSEIQRNILAERLLGLPKEPAPDRTLPWNQLQKGSPTS